MSEPILSARGVSKRFGGVQALKDVSFDLYPGEVLALAGDNGAGKSTLIKAIAGVHHPEEGSITFDGKDLSGLLPGAVRDLGIETIYQDLALADNLDVGLNLFLGRELIRHQFGFLPVLDRAKMRSESGDILKSLGIRVPDPTLPVGNLSGGQRQAIAISRAIYWNARLLIMDEPTAALGVPEQRLVRDLVHRLRERQVAIIYISHNLNDIFAVSDRILVLERGRKAGERKASETNDNELVKLMMGSA